MNIFSTLNVYAEKYAVKDTRKFTPEELAAVDHAVVVESQYGLSACFYMKAGGQTYIPMSTEATAGLGEELDLTKAELVTLGRPGSEDIVRVQI